MHLLYWMLEMTVPFWVLGSLGMIAVEASYLPQIMRLAQRKSAEDVSLVFPALNLVGRLLALAYSITRGDSVFVTGFIVGAFLRGTLLVQVAHYRGWLSAVRVRS